MGYYFVNFFSLRYLAIRFNLLIAYTQAYSLTYIHTHTHTQTHIHKHTRKHSHEPICTLTRTLLYIDTNMCTRMNT